MDKRPVNQRIIKAIELLANNSKARFCERINLSQNTLNGYLGERDSDPSATVLEKILIGYQNLNADWLLTGRGEMLKSTKDSIMDADSMDIESAMFIQDLEKQINTQSKLNLKLSRDLQRVLAENEELKKKTA